MHSRTFTRRHVLAVLGIASAGALLAACGPTAPPAPTAAPAAATKPPVAAPAATNAPTTAPVAAVKPTVAASTGTAPAAAPAAAIGTKKVSLRWATNAVGNSPMVGPTRGIVKKFTEDYPNVTVDIEETPGNDHQTKIKLDASSDRLPDIFNYWRMDPVFGLDQIVDAGKIADLTEWTKSDPFFKDLDDEAAWKTASRKGKVYGLPLTMFFVQFLANKDVLDRAGIAQAPTTWPDLIAAMKTLKTKGELPWGASIKGDSHGGRIYNHVYNRMVGNDRAMKIHAGEEPYAIPESIKAAGFLRELTGGYLPEDAIAIDNAAAVAKYVNTGKAAFVLCGSFDTGTIKPEIQDKMQVLEFPLVPGGFQTEKNIEKDLTGLWYMSAKSWADTDKLPVVQELAKRFSSREAGKIYAEQAQQPIPMLNVNIDETKVGKMATTALKLSLQRPQNRWIPSLMKPDARAKFDPLVGEYLNGKYSPEEFVQNVNKALSGG